MIIAVISDIHSNLEALNQVLERIDSDIILCSGDIVGYYTWPNECIEKIRKIKVISVTGNHDFACLTGNTQGFNPYAKEMVEWTRKNLNDKNIEFLGNLKRKIRLKIHETDIVMVHGSPRNPLNEYIFPKIPDSTLKSFIKSEDMDVLIVGHTHMPFIRKFGDKLVLSPGSVGQPRDHDKRASFAFLDLSKRDAQIFKVTMI